VKKALMSILMVTVLLGLLVSGISCTKTKTISLNLSTLSFTATQGASNPKLQTIEIRDSNGGTFDWSVGSSAPWITLSPTSGISSANTGTFTVDVNTDGMSAGSYNASIRIFVPGATNRLQIVPVSLTIKNPSQLQVHFIDVGQGDSILLDLGTTEVLIDGGDGHTNIVPYLQQYVDGSLEAMIATHPHDDHIGGLISVMNNFDVDMVLTNGESYGTSTYSDFMDKAWKETPEVDYVSRGDTFTVGNLAFKVLNPEESLPLDINGNSIVMELDYGSVTFLFTGDAQWDSEVSMVDAGLIHHIDILKVGHHGSDTSSTEEFLDKTSPEVAVYMAGIGNSYGHPRPVTISNLKKIEAKIYGTDTCGTITVTTDGSGYTVSTAKKCSIATPTPTPKPTPTPTPPIGPCNPNCECYSYTLHNDIQCSQAGAICKDGTCSMSRGSGTCSHHGGVRKWINCP